MKKVIICSLFGWSIFGGILVSFQAEKTAKLAVEVINLHPQDYYADIEELKTHLLSKIITKIDNEIVGVDTAIMDFKIAYLPVLWSTDIKSLAPYYDYFKKIQQQTLKKKDKEVIVLGFTSFISIYNEINGDRHFEYGYLDQLIEKME